MVVTRRLVGKFGQAGKSDAPPAGIIEPCQQIGFAFDAEVRRRGESTCGPTRRRSKDVFGGIRKPAKLALDRRNAILDGDKRIESRFEPSRALRRGQGHGTTRRRVKLRPIGKPGGS
jgi:hypothetical protein